MVDHDLLFLAGPPNLSDPHYVAALRELFGVNRRNVVLLAVYFLILLALAVGALHWVTRGFASWRLTAVGWTIVAAFALIALLPVWRLVAEEGPRLAYGRPPEAFARLQPVRGVVEAYGAKVALGRPLPMRKMHWRTEQPPAQGETPYLPQPVTLRAPPGTPVWVGLDPAGASPPLFLGFAR